MMQTLMFLQGTDTAAAVPGQLLAAASSVVSPFRQGNICGPHAASHELGSGAAYGPWTWHSVWACNARHRHASCHLMLSPQSKT